MFFIQNITKEKCVGSINNFHARSRHFSITSYISISLLVFTYLNYILQMLYVTVSTIKTCSFRNCDFVIFICLAYLFTLIVYLESSLSHIVRVKSHTICTYLHIILHISLIFLYVNHFWFFKIVLKLSGDVEENPGPKPIYS